MSIYTTEDEEERKEREMTARPLRRMKISYSYYVTEKREGGKEEGCLLMGL